jgi:predicted HAD superfamily Cof-like phosphohydrolase
MQQLIKDLIAFHKACDVKQWFKNLKDIPDDIYELRLRLLEEEFEEFKEAHKNKDKVEMADALADMIYIAVGTANVMNIPLDKVWAEVQRSNMDKVDPETGKVKKREDGKVLKPEGWQGPKVKEVIDEHEMSS